MPNNKLTKDKIYKAVKYNNHFILSVLTIFINEVQHYVQFKLNYNIYFVNRIQI